MAARLTLRRPAHRRHSLWRVIARLRPGATTSSGRRRRTPGRRHCSKAAPAEPATHRGAELRFRLEPMQSYLTSRARPAILALMGAVIFLLLIACSNVANLSPGAGIAGAGRDPAVRTALGANWWRVARQMLAEALLVAALRIGLGIRTRPGRGNPRLAG